MAATNEEIREFAEQILKDRVFMGSFHEKRYVKRLNSYRDVIRLDKDERDLCADLIKVKNYSLSHNPNGWFGFSEPDDIDAPPSSTVMTYSIWTVLDKCDPIDWNVATTVFGDYWFQIKAIHLIDDDNDDDVDMDAIEMEMKILRPIEQMASSLSSTVSNTSAALTTMAQQAIADIDATKMQQYFKQNVIEVNWIQLFVEWRTAINRTIYHFLFTELNWPNIRHCAQMFALFLMVTFKTTVSFVQWLGEFTLKLVFELTQLFRAITPISLAIINLIGKVIGGFYIVVAMIWRDSFGSNTNRSNRTTTNMRAAAAYNNNNNNNNNQHRPAIGYRRDLSR